MDSSITRYLGDYDCTNLIKKVNHGTPSQIGKVHVAGFHEVLTVSANYYVIYLVNVWYYLLLVVGLGS